MGADDEDGIRSPQPGWQLLHKLDHCPVAGIPENRQRAAAMGEIDDLGLLGKIILIRHEGHSIGFFFKCIQI
jgi:hypothetical protein